MVLWGVLAYYAWCVLYFTLTLSFPPTVSMCPPPCLLPSSSPPPPSAPPCHPGTCLQQACDGALVCCCMAYPDCLPCISAPVCPPPFPGTCLQQACVVALVCCHMVKPDCLPCISAPVCRPFPGTYLQQACVGALVCCCMAHLAVAKHCWPRQSRHRSVGHMCW
jgi:hypothetical protein